MHQLLSFLSLPVVGQGQHKFWSCLSCNVDNEAAAAIRSIMLSHMALKLCWRMFPKCLNIELNKYRGERSLGRDTSTISLLVQAAIMQISWQSFKALNALSMRNVRRLRGEGGRRETEGGRTEINRIAPTLCDRNAPLTQFITTYRQ